YFFHVDYFETNSIVPWHSEGDAGIHVNSDFAYSGANNAWIKDTADWNSIYQPIKLEPNTNYKLTAWVQTSNHNVDGRLGVRLPHGQEGTVMNELSFGMQGNYTRQTVTFNSGTNSSVEVFAGLHATTGNSWLRIDNISLEIIPDFKSASKQVETFIEKKGIVRALQAKLIAAEDARNQGNEQACKNQLQAFINQVNAQAGKAIDKEEAISLIFHVINFGGAVEFRTCNFGSSLTFTNVELGMIPSILSIRILHACSPISSIG